MKEEETVNYWKRPFSKRSEARTVSASSVENCCPYAEVRWGVNQTRFEAEVTRAVSAAKEEEEETNYFGQPSPPSN